MVRSELEEQSQLDVVGGRYFVDNKHIDGEWLTAVTKSPSRDEFRLQR